MTAPLWELVCAWLLLQPLSAVSGARWCDRGRLNLSRGGEFSRPTQATRPSVLCSVCKAELAAGSLVALNNSGQQGQTSSHGLLLHCYNRHWGSRWGSHDILFLLSLTAAYLSANQPIGIGRQGIFTERMSFNPWKEAVPAHFLDEVLLNLSDNCINKSPGNLLVRFVKTSMPSRESPACKQAPIRADKPSVTGCLLSNLCCLTLAACSRRICRITACYRDQSDPLTWLTVSFYRHLSHNLF